jgi:uroporphyrinogen III methyltransferase / synthase
VGEAISMPLQGKRVVVTRAAEQSSSLLQALREKGANPILLPLLAFTPPDDSRALDEACRQLSRFDWLFLTSQNALRALQERCKFLHLSLGENCSGVRIAAVGPATADAANAAGLQVSYIATKHQGFALAEELAAQVRGKRVLLPRSDRANPELLKVLDRFDANVTEVVAYKTIRPSDEEIRHQEGILRDGFDAILFFSPSAVHHFEEIVGTERFRKLSREAVFTAIGPVTEGALHSAGVHAVLSAKDTSVASVIEALAEFFAKTGQGLSAGVKRG